MDTIAAADESAFARAPRQSHARPFKSPCPVVLAGRAMYVASRGGQGACPLAPERGEAAHGLSELFGSL